MEKFKELLEELNACDEAIEWAKDMPIEEVVKTCHRGDWLLWLVQKMELDLRTLTLAKARCAKTVIHLMKDDRSIKAIEVAYQFGVGDATIEELMNAHAAATAATAAADAAATAATAAADAAAYAATAAAYAAYAAYAAAATAAAYAAYAAAADAAAYAAAKKENQKQTADICRETFGELLIELVNKKLN